MSQEQTLIPTDSNHFMAEFMKALWDAFFVGERICNSFMGMCLAQYGPFFDAIPSQAERRIATNVDHIESSPGGFHKVIFLQPRKTP